MEFDILNECEDSVRAAYADQFDRWQIGVDLLICADGVQALLEVFPAEIRDVEEM